MPREFLLRFLLINCDIYAVVFLNLDNYDTTSFYRLITQFNAVAIS